jgi:thiol peroxidase
MDFFGQSVTIIGQDLVPGSVAPDFIAQRFDWTLVNAIKNTEGKVRIIGSLPSLNTPVCDKETRRFNEIADTLGDDVLIIMISMDLPWTQKQWCTASRVDQILVLSDHINADFGIKYGVLLEEPRILRRAIFVVDSTNVIRSADYMQTLAEEPDYDTVIQVAKQTVSGT